MTHGIGFLPQCDKIVVMVDGKITETGTYTELIENNGAFAEFLRNYSNVDNEEEEPGGNCMYTSVCVCFEFRFIMVGTALSTV